MSSISNISNIYSKAGIFFERTENISVSSFNNMKTSSTKVLHFHLNQQKLKIEYIQAKSFLDCAHKCLYYVNSGSGQCNSYSYNNNSLLCELASLTYLEDPLPDRSDGGEKKVMVDVTVLESLPRNCRGGEHCCRPDNKCALNTGDCNHDHDCQGVSICGKDNCPIKSGGRWDAEDDCCERRCTPDHPCNEGEGHCESDSDCIKPGWAKCGNDLCLNTQYFPTAKYPNNSAWFGFTGSDNCCYRVCNKDYYRCGNGIAGCKTNEDCNDGHYCDTDMPLPTCYELNECEIDNTYFNGTAYCGIESTCTNNVGSFSCPCDSGFVAHVPWVGCRDKNECTEGGHTCKANTDCWNWYGSHNCTCKVN